MGHQRGGPDSLLLDRLGVRFEFCWCRLAVEPTGEERADAEQAGNDAGDEEGCAAGAVPGESGPGAGDDGANTCGSGLEAECSAFRGGGYERDDPRLGDAVGERGVGAVEGEEGPHPDWTCRESEPGVGHAEDDEAGGNDEVFGNPVGECSGGVAGERVGEVAERVCGDDGRDAEAEMLGTQVAARRRSSRTRTLSWSRLTNESVLRLRLNQADRRGVAIGDLVLSVRVPFSEAQRESGGRVDVSRRVSLRSRRRRGERGGRPLASVVALATEAEQRFDRGRRSGRRRALHNDAATSPSGLGRRSAFEPWSPLR